jgi:hypothetical protein
LCGRHRATIRLIVMLAATPSPPSNGLHIGPLLAHAYGLAYVVRGPLGSRSDPRATTTTACVKRSSEALAIAFHAIRHFGLRAALVAARCSFAWMRSSPATSARRSPADDEQESVLVFDRHLLLHVSGRLRPAELRSVRVTGASGGTACRVQHRDVRALHKATANPAPTKMSVSRSSPVPRHIQPPSRKDQKTANLASVRDSSVPELTAA